MAIISATFMVELWLGQMISIKVKDTLELQKEALHLFSEVKWQKVTKIYLEKYMILMDEFFRFIKQDKVKVRIMFTHNRYEPTNLTLTQRKNEYFLLYFQFFKHAFGLNFSNPLKGNVSLYPFFDQLPDTKEKNEAFIDFIYRLQFEQDFLNSQ
ncbi:hypothetical protein [Virgibacillus ihumii]|uniref:hypothetical protein n=1 Tax=Virgibacillus ihumii TaxID=2686091 RepID=UPI001FE5F2A7|nr:hypothetical protein [Virgibacillus ihumii]